MSLKAKYQKQIRPKLSQEWGLKNPLAASRVEKVVVSMGLGEAKENKRLLASAEEDLKTLTGQKPKVTVARQSIAGFQLRKGDPVGLMVTLRGERMYSFLERLFKIVLPRVRDFQGVPSRGFDGQGNYSLGLPEQIVFPEVDYAKVEKVRGLQVTIVTSAQNDQKAQRLLEELGMPFAKKGG